MSDYIEDEDEELEGDDYATEMWCIQDRLAGGGSLDSEDVNKLLNYIERLESTISELASKTGFADDYPGGWQGYIEQEYE